MDELPETTVDAITGELKEVQNNSIVQMGLNKNLVRQIANEEISKRPSGGTVASIQAGSGISVNSADPANPIVSATGSGTGDMLKSTYDPANIAQQLVGTTASQTITNKTMSGASNTFSNIPESAVTNLTTDLAAKSSKAFAIAMSVAL